MCSSFLKALAIMLFCSSLLVAEAPLTFCADPQNSPFSTSAQTGFENKVAKILGAELHRPVRFHWVRMGRGFVREVVNKGACDAIAAVPVGMRGLLITAPYYRSTYVFVTRTKDRPIVSLDDPRLESMKIGVQVLDDDYAPPARALARRRLTKNVVGFDMDQGAGRIISAVANRTIDAAIVWGPLAGYYKERSGKSLRLTAVSPETDPPKLPFTFEISVGVRKNEPELYAQINNALRRAEPKIRTVLRDFGVPMLPLGQNAGERTGSE
jgi:mxaJ protein